MARYSILDKLGLPREFGILLLTFFFILLVSPYLAGKDLGIFKVPIFNKNTTAVLKILGPIAFAFMLFLYMPIFKSKEKEEIRLLERTQRLQTNLRSLHQNAELWINGIEFIVKWSELYHCTSEDFRKLKYSLYSYKILKKQAHSTLKELEKAIRKSNVDKTILLIRRDIKELDFFFDKENAENIPKSIEKFLNRFIGFVNRARSNTETLLKANPEPQLNDIEKEHLKNNQNNLKDHCRTFDRLIKEFDETIMEFLNFSDQIIRYDTQR